MATIKTDFRCDLTKPVQVQYLDGNLFTLDNGGNTINVYCYEGEEPATLGGSVSANVIRPDGSTVTVTGSLSGNQCSVVLPQAAYAVPGHVTIIIKVTQDTTVTTIAAIVANNMLSSTDTIVDPGTIIPSVQALIAQIETAIGSIPADYSALLATLAADYSPSKTYPVVGMYAWQGGVLKRNIVPITTAETYTAAHWTNAVLGDDVSDLKSAINNDFDNIIGKRNLLYNVGITQGKAISSSGVVETNSAYSYTDEIALPEGKHLLITQKSSTTGTTRVHGYKNGTWVKQVNYGTSTSGVINVTVDSTVDAIRISYNHQTTNLETLMLGRENVVQMIEMVQDASNDTNQMIQIESQLNSNGEYTFIQSDIINGGYNSDGSYASNNNQLRTKQIFTLNGDCSLLFIPGETAVKMRYAYKTKTGSSYSVSSWKTSESLIHFVEPEKIIIMFQNSAGNAISPSEYDATTTLIRFSVSSQDSCTIPVHLERGSYASGNNYYGDSSTFNDYVINQYPIKLNGATQIIFSGLPNGEISTNIYLYTSEGSRIRYDSYSITNGKIISIADTSCYYIDISFADFDYWKYNVRLTAIKHGGAVAEEVKRIYKNSSNTIIKYFMVDEQEEIFTTMNYMLPPNYTHDGAKVPVVLWFDGNTGYSNMGEPFNVDKMPGLTYLRDEGYAVIEIFSWGSYFVSKYPNCGRDQPYPIPTNLKILKAGLDYFTSRYNVDADNIHVVSKSVGGMISLYFVSNPIYPFKSINMFAPVLDFISMRGRYSDAKKAIAEELDLQGNLTDFYDADFQYFSEDGETFWTTNKDKLLRLNSAWVNLIGAGFDTQFSASFADARTWWADKTSTNVYTNDGFKKIGCVPAKIWGSADDTETPYPIMPEVVKQLQNAGCFAEMRTIPNGWGGHSSADIAGTYNTIASITTALGITHTDVPIGWAEAVEWIRINSMKT